MSEKAPFKNKISYRVWWMWFAELVEKREAERVVEFERRWCRFARKRQVSATGSGCAGTEACCQDVRKGK